MLCFFTRMYLSLQTITIRAASLLPVQQRKCEGIPGVSGKTLCPLPGGEKNPWKGECIFALQGERHRIFRNRKEFFRL